MPISNALEMIQPTEIKYSGIVSSNSSTSLHSKSSINSERLPSDSFSDRKVDSRIYHRHVFFEDNKESKFFQLERSLNAEEEDSSNNKEAYYSDFYNSSEQLPAMKKCENFHKKNNSSKSDDFKMFAIRRFSLNPEILRKAKASRSMALTYFSLDDMASYHQFHDRFSDWNGKSAFTQKTADFEENMSMSSDHFDSSSDSLTSSSSGRGQSLEKSIRNYFKNRVDRDSTSSLCTSQSSSCAMTPFPEETVNNFETSDMFVEEEQIINSSTFESCKQPTFVNITTAAEQMLLNLGFCDSSEIIPERFFAKVPKQKHKEAPQNNNQEKVETETLSENKELENSVKTTEDVISNGRKRKDMKVDINVEHLLMNKKKDGIKSCNRTRSLDFEEINRSTVHVINNNKHLFYKQKSIQEEIEEASRNTKSLSFENKPAKNSSVIDNLDKNQTEDPIENSKNEQKDAETAHSTIPNIVVSKKLSIAKIPKTSQECFEIESIFAECKPTTDVEVETKIESGPGEKNRFWNSDSFLSVSFTSSPTESPLTVINMSFDDSKDKVIRSSEDIQNQSTQSSVDLDADDTLNDILDEQFEDIFAYNSNSLCIEEQSPKWKHHSFLPSKTSSSSFSDIEEWYWQDDENCSWNAAPLNPYLTSGPDMVTIYKNASRVNNEDHKNQKSSSGSYTSSFNMAIKTDSKECSDERTRLIPNTFSPLVINGIRFNKFKRGSADGEDTKESEVLRPADYFSSDLPAEKIAFYSRESETKKDEDGNSKDSANVQNEGNNTSEAENRDDMNGCREIKVSTAKLIFKKVSQHPWHNKISSKVILKNKTSQRDNSKTGTKITNCTKDSWTQCNLDGYQRSRNICNDKNLLKNHFSKNSCHQDPDSLMESKRKILAKKKPLTTQASIQKHSSINTGLGFFNTSAAAQNIFTDLSRKVQFPNNSDTEKAVLSLHKSSQTKFVQSFHPSCKTALNICAKCLHHKNVHCL